MESANEFSSSNNGVGDEELGEDYLAWESKALFELDLFEGIINQDAETVQQAVQAGVDVNCAHDTHVFPRPTPLLEACVNGNDRIIRILLDAGADARWEDIDGQHYAGWTALTDVCKYGHLSAVQLLVNHDNCLMEIADVHGCAPIFEAILHQHSDIVRFLLDRGANVFALGQIGVPHLWLRAVRAILKLCGC